MRRILTHDFNHIFVHNRIWSHLLTFCFTSVVNFLVPLPRITCIFIQTVTFQFVLGCVSKISVAKRGRKRKVYQITFYVLVCLRLCFVGRRVIHLNPKQQTRHSPMTVLLTQLPQIYAFSSVSHFSISSLYQAKNQWYGHDRELLFLTIFSANC